MKTAHKTKKPVIPAQAGIQTVIQFREADKAVYRVLSRCAGT
jgi:hypothetical protein